MSLTYSGLSIDAALRDFVATELLAGLDLPEERFWQILAELQQRFGSPIQALLARRDELQARIDDWHRQHGAPDPAGIEAFLTEIGYLVPVPEVQVRVEGVDPEISERAGPQVGVPATVPRYALNAANARWGSLYDALYGTDVLAWDHEPAPGYDPVRGAQVIAEADRLLDELFPLDGAAHAEVTAYRVLSGQLSAVTASGEVGLADPTQFAGFSASSILLVRHGVHVVLVTDRTHPVGASHHAGLADVQLESAITTIVDLEDSVATVDGADKAAAYRTWLGLMTGALTSDFEKDGRVVHRAMTGDRAFKIGRAHV